MSLISPKNFIAPFTNVVNLATIIVVALLFLIYRLSGGGVAMSSRKAPPQTNREATVKEAPVNKVASAEKRQETQEAQAAPARSLHPSADNSAIDDLLDRKPSNDYKKQNSPSNPGGSSLDDIAKQLGVE